MTSQMTMSRSTAYRSVGRPTELTGESAAKALSEYEGQMSGR
jgi:hypothetical protein